ncbi:MAG: hypothetical protein U1A78_30020 [Polyangia bacterium]
MQKTISQRLMVLAVPFLFACGYGSGNPNMMMTEDPANTAPHALGQIVLGESHSPGGGTASPRVSAGFIPDTKAAKKKCTMMIAGCEIGMTPKCGTTPDGGCDFINKREVCQFDDSCQAKCVKLCDARCGADEECYFPSPDAPSCRKRETFDAGALSFAGTTTSITLFPPYSFTSMGNGAPFLEKSELTVQASGATTAGFDAFTHKFTATTYLRTEPALNKITKAQAFGTGPVPVKWVPGADQIVLTVSGPAGAATCAAKDETGSFDVPREVVAAVVGDRTDINQSLAISVMRQRKEVKKGQKTKGMLLTQMVQPDGWLELTTTSSESASFTGCSAGTALCGGDMCVDVRYDEENCGKCGNACASSDRCSNGKCQGPGACQQCVNGAETGACKVESDACTQDGGATGCSALRACMRSCSPGDSTCTSKCSTAASNGAKTKYNALATCLNDACRTDCSF